MANNYTKTSITENHHGYDPRIQRVCLQRQHARHGLITSLVKDVISPIIGLIGGQDFSSIGIGLTEQAREAMKSGTAEAIKAGEPVIGIGLFVNALIAFIITAFVLFMIVKGVNKAKNAQEEEAGPTQEELLAEIRDALKK